MDPHARARNGLAPVFIAITYIVAAACAGFGTGLAVSMNPAEPVQPQTLALPQPPAGYSVQAAPQMPATSIVLTLPGPKDSGIPIALGVPVPGPISSPFGYRWGRQHEGIDIACSYGRQVRATAEGRVTYAGTKGTYGRLIVLEHASGVETLYGHLSEIAVKKGQKVAKGAVIGKAGNSGRSTGPHLHFEVRLRGRPVDPAPVLGITLSQAGTSREASRT